MDEKRKAELRGLCERASKAPWYWVQDTLCADRDFPVVLKATLENEKDAGLFVHGCDKEFIAAARTALPELLDDNDAKDREIARLNAGKLNRPEIVCLCGSTRFYQEFDRQNFRLTLEGKIVLSIGCNTKSDEGLCLTVDDKVRLDELHKRKIDLCDRVLVLNVGWYIGESTRSEIEYAKAHGKPVEYLEPTEGGHDNG